jgi:hypothetical protein
LLRSQIHFYLLLALYGAAGCAEVVVDEPEGELDRAGAGGSGSSFAPASPTPMAPAAAVAVPSSPVSGAGPREPTAGASGAAGTGAPLPAAAPVAPPLPTGGPPGEVLLVDDFEDGDAVGWIADADDGEDLVGNWAVVDSDEGRAYAQLDDSFDDDSWAVGGSVSWTDVNFESRFRFTAASDIEDAVAMVALRFQSRENYYYVEYRGDGSVKIRKRVDGSEPELSSEDLERVAVIGEWIDIGFRARGTSLQVTVDGVVVGTEVTDADLASGGIGLGVKENSAVEFDDVRVSVP